MCHTPTTSIVVGLSSHEGNSLGPIVTEEGRVDVEGAFRRVGSSIITFSNAGQDPGVDVGIFKAEKGAPEISSPSQEQTELMSPLAFPVPVSEGDHNGLVPVYSKPLISRHMQESCLEVLDEGPVDVSGLHRNSL